MVLLGLIQGVLAAGDSGGTGSTGPMAVAVAGMWAGRIARNSTKSDPPVEGGDREGSGTAGEVSDTDGYI